MVYNKGLYPTLIFAVKLDLHYVTTLRSIYAFTNENRCVIAKILPCVLYVGIDVKQYLH